MNGLAVVIITKDESGNIGRCLDSVAWADECHVVDTGSVDDTVALAEERGCTVHRIEWRGFGPSKAYGFTRAASPWILSLDADEVVTGALAAEIRQALEHDEGVSGYYLPRLTNFMGRWIYHSAWYPDFVLRLFRREEGRIVPALVHEEITVAGATRRLREPLRHYSYPDAATYFKKLDRYTTLAAREMMKKKRRYSSPSVALKAAASFYRHYISGAGFLDGLDGFVIAALSSLGTVMKYRKLHRLERDGDRA